MIYDLKDIVFKFEDSRFEDKIGNLQDFLIAKFARFKRLKNQAIRQLGNQEIRKFSRFGRFNYYIADC